MRRLRLGVKRTFDVAGSALGLLVLAIPLLLIGLAVALDSRGGVLFRQTRVGLNGREFKILKFRTMVAQAEAAGPQITSGADKRITRVGGFLRRTKLDELPQLVNVLIGEMSFVGPRPEVPRYVALYTPEQRRVLSVRPGITEYASIKFRNEAALLTQSEDMERTYIEQIMPQKLRLNLNYVDGLSLRTDIHILLQTLIKIHS